MVTFIRSCFIVLILLSGCGWNGTPTRPNDFAQLTSIEIGADYSTIAALTSTRLKVKGNYAGPFTRDDITDQVVWSIDSPELAGFVTATDRSRVTGLKPGTVILTATVGRVSSTFALTVSSAIVTKLTITPDNSNFAKGQTSQFTATGTFSDLSTQNITFDSSWSSSIPGVATISNEPAGKGFATAVAVGSATISSTFDGISGSTVMTVTEPVLQSIALSLTNPSILTLSTKKITASGTYSDGSTSDITSQVTWKSSNEAIASIAGDGTVTTLTQGTSTISASLGSAGATTILRATGGNLTAITVLPSTVTLVKDISGRISATGAFSNGSRRDITGVVQWSTANTSLATVTPAGGTLEWLNPLAVTLVPAVITATSGSLSANASLAIIAPQLTSIAFTTTTLDLTAGTSSPLTVSATFSDGTIQDVTSLSTWAPSNPAIATIAKRGPGTERVTGIVAGSTTISATYGGNTVPVPATVTVRSRTLMSLTISGTSTVAAGNQVSFTATANYGDGTSVDVTSDAATVWTLDKPNVAILADSQNLPGQIVGVDSGSATLTVNFSGFVQTALISVIGP